MEMGVYTMFQVQHQIFNTNKWYTVRTVSELEKAKSEAINYCLSNGGYGRIVKGDEFIYFTYPH